MPLETTPWDVTDGMATEQSRLGFLFACVDDDPNDDAFISIAVEAVHRSRKRYGTTEGRPMTLKRIEKLMATYPAVSFQSVARIVEVLGYGFDMASLEPSSKSRTPARAAAKRTHSANRTQRRRKA